MKVYIAGPYSRSVEHPDMVLNVRAAIAAGDEVLAHGDAPFIPHLTHFWHLVFPKPYEAWLAYDKVWVQACDALLRLPGDSPGSDREEAWARMAGMVVWHGLPEYLCARIPPRVVGRTFDGKELVEDASGHWSIRKPRAYDLDDCADTSEGDR